MPSPDLTEPAGVGSGLAPGTVFSGRYEIVRCLKAGGMGAVYEALHLETRRRRALKVMLPSIVENAEMRARFKLEATVAADIESEHIVETMDAGVDEATGAPFLVMELLRGEDLAALLARKGRLSAEETVLFLSQLALALDKTHAAGIVHRDLKPENLFVTYRDDRTPRLKVLDFGIAKVVSQSSRSAGQTRGMGTPLYMSPEQVRGDGRIGPASDLHAVGHIAYTLLTGEAYWEEEGARGGSVYPLLLCVARGATEGALERALRRRQVSLSPGFDAWFARATAVKENERFLGALEMVGALAEALGVELPRGFIPSAVVGDGTLPPELAAELANAATVTVQPTGRTKTSGPGSSRPPAAPAEPRGGSTTAAVLSEPQARSSTRSTRPVTLTALAVAALVGIVVLGVRLVGGTHALAGAAAAPPASTAALVPPASTAALVPPASTATLVPPPSAASLAPPPEPAPAPAKAEAAGAGEVATGRAPLEPAASAGPVPGAPSGSSARGKAATLGSAPSPSARALTAGGAQGAPGSGLGRRPVDERQPAAPPASPLPAPTPPSPTGHSFD